MESTIDRTRIEANGDTWVTYQVDNVMHTAYAEAWAIVPERLRLMLDMLGSATVDKAAPSEAGGPRRAADNVKGAVAVLPLYGVVAQRMDWLTRFFGGTSTDAFGAAFTEIANDSKIGAIVIDVDSPGGAVYGVQELSKLIYDARRSDRPIYAIGNSLMASAAYWIGSAADKVFVTPSGEVGSIGVVAVHTDVSEAERSMGITRTIIQAGKYKTEGTPLRPLDDEARDYIQQRVDTYYSAFLGDVARNRGTTKSQVERGYGEGRVLGSEDAKKAGLVDGIATLPKLLSDLAGKVKATAKRRAWQGALDSRRKMS